MDAARDDVRSREANELSLTQDAGTAVVADGLAPVAEGDAGLDAVTPAGRIAGIDIVYFTHDFTEVSTVTHARAFRLEGMGVAVFAFQRGRYNAAFEAPWPQVALGRTADEKYLQRVSALIGALPIIWRQRRLLRGASIFYARNMDQLLLAFASMLIARRKAMMVYEVLDVVPAFTRDGAMARILRLIERALLRHIQCLVVSSPGYLRNYFGPVQGYRGPNFLLENKLDPISAAALERSREVKEPVSLPRQRYKWTIGYFGLLRGQETFDLITRLAERFSDDVLFYFRGIVTNVDAASFAAAIVDHDNMVYGGPYVNPDDLGQIYGSVDLVWTLQIEEEDHNARWLMPCRFYEAGALGVPCLAAQGFEVGNRIDEQGIGWTVAAPYMDSLDAFLGNLTHQEYDTVRARLAALGRESFVLGEDSAALCKLLRDELKASAGELPAPA